MVLNQKTGKEREISTINEVRFGILSPEEILNRSVAHINEPNLYDSSGNPRYNGLFDPRMGVIERKRQCLTCKQSYVECPGHFGHIEFAKPVYHMQYIVQIRKILECVCNHCGKLLIAKDNIAIEHALRKNPADRLDFIRLKVKTKICGLFLVGKNKGDESEELHGCGFEKPTKIGSKEHNHVQVEYIKEVKNEETGDVTKEVIEQPYTPDMVLSIFKRISPEDALILGFSKDWCLPHWLIYTVLAVVPPSVRPSVRLHNSQRSEDDITHKYNDIIKQNNQLSEFIKNGDSEELIRDYHHLIQCHVATLVDNNAKGVIGEAKHRTGRPLKTFKQRLHGKEGRIRSNLMGKRVDFSARSVISPDPSLDIDQLGVPIKIAMNLTYPEIVNKYNINNLYKLVRNGSKVYPGSNSYTNTEEGVTKTFDHIDTSKIVLKYGDIVNRHLINEDIVLFNRQPSLHKMSMMAHSIKIIPSKTFRFNVDVCKPYNADFDGDEMNMHVPQSIQAATELRYLASVRKQIISPSTNSPIIAPSQDNLLGLYKITEDDVFFTHREVMNLMTKVKAFKGSLPPPAISNGKKIRWSGKQLISMILPPISITISDKNVKCQITKGQIISGRINKTVSTTIVHIIFSEYGFDEAARYMNDLQRIIKGYMVRSGFSIGMSDLIVHKDIRKKNEEYILDTKKDVIDMTKKVHLNIFENITKNIEGVYEAMITKRLSETTNRIQSETTANITEENNRVKYMVASGSKGNATNIMQMMCLVGQQIIDGKRIPLGFSDRSLPHFLRYDNGVESKGFVVNNYLDGLTPTEFFFHAEGGREGLIDTAVKTARSGYLQRKLVKTMEDLKVEHDYTVRNSNNKIVQFIYGNDGFNPIHLQKQTIDNLIVPEDEILEDKYLMDSKEKWDKYMTTKSVSEMKKDNYQNKIKEYNEYLNNMIISINELHQQNVSVNKTAEKHRIVLFPVNFDSFLRNIKNIYHLDGKGKSDVSPFEIMDMYQQLYKTAYKNVKTDNRMFSVLMMEKLSPVYLIKYVRITKVALESMLNTILNKYKKALIQGGESVGPIAGQSIGELSTQLTLNSVDWETFMLFNINNSSVTTKIGEFIDDLLEKNKNNNKIKYIKENRTEYLELDDDINIKVPSIDCGDKKSGGHMNWCKVSAITRHLPVGDLVKIKTESGREVIATQQKSFLIWNKDRITTTNGSDLKIGDKIPVNKKCPDISKLNNTPKIINILNNIYENQSIYNNKINTISMNDVILDKIVSIDYVKPTHQYVYDLTVPDTLNFGILNGIQMRDTFHLAGVGSKSSVNQGVPRLEELLEQHKPKNPSLNIFLNGEYALDSDKADQVCYNIEIVKIKDIITSDAIYFEPTNDLSDVLEEDRDIMKLYQVFSELDAQSANIPNNPWIIRLEFNRHNMLEKKITMSDINLILKHHLPKSNIVFADDNSGKLIFRIRFDFDSNVNQADDDISLLNEQIEYIKNITIKGVDDILHAYKIENNNKIVKDGDKYVSQKEYMIETTGSNLFDILCKSYVDSRRTYSINVLEMYETFGIEAARWILEKEIIGVFVLSDASTNPRHVKLLCDLMTNRGTIMAANRNGINQSDNEIGPLAKSSFEETIGQLTMAGLYGISDKLKGVSSNIMVGQIPKCGTGYSEILLDEDKLQDIEDDEDSAYAHVDYQDNVDNVNKLFDSSDYCADNNMIQFNIGNIDGDEINLDNISIPINI